MPDESLLIAEFLATTLANSTEVTALVGPRIFDTEAPQKPIAGQDVIYPCIIFQMQSPSDVSVVNGVRIFVRPLWVVKVIVDNDTYKNASLIYSAVDDALHLSSGSVSGGVIYKCWRDPDRGDPIRYSEPKPAGGYFRHRGGIYRIEAQSA